MKVEIKPCVRCSSDQIEMLSVTDGNLEISRRERNKIKVYVSCHLFHCLGCDYIERTSFNHTNLNINEVIGIWNRLNDKEKIKKDILLEVEVLEKKAKELREKAEKI